jgi:hypothetical protein
LKPERWGSPLAQEEKYQEKSVERIRNNNNNKTFLCFGVLHKQPDGQLQIQDKKVKQNIIMKDI